MLYWRIVTESKLLLRGFDAYTYGPVILVHPGSVSDEALLSHEKTHVAQFWRWFGLNGLMYRFSKTWRLRFEVEAYREQLKRNLLWRSWFAHLLATRYDLDVSRDEAMRLLDLNNHEDREVRNGSC